MDKQHKCINCQLGNPKNWFIENIVGGKHIMTPAVYCYVTYKVKPCNGGKYCNHFIDKEKKDKK